MDIRTLIGAAAFLSVVLIGVIIYFSARKKEKTPGEKKEI